MAGTVVLSKDQTRNGFANVSKNTANKVDIYNEKDVLNARHSTSDRTIMLWVEFFFLLLHFVLSVLLTPTSSSSWSCVFFTTVLKPIHTQREREK